MAEPSRSPQYRGEDLDPARGPGLGCFWLQVVLLAIAVVLTPVSAFARWSPIATVLLMALTIVLLLFVGQTVIFLLRIVAAERGQRRPLASPTRTVGEIEAAQRGDGTAPGREPPAPAGQTGTERDGAESSGVRE